MIRPLSIRNVSSELHATLGSGILIGMFFMLGTSVLDLIEIIFSHHGIQSVRFDGKMDKSSRDNVLVQFKQPGRPNVILIR